MTYSPWADAAERYPDVHIERRDIAPMRGVWVPSERVILIDSALDMAGRRATLAHELSHVDLKHRPAVGWFGRRMEREADQLAARRLLPDVDAIGLVLATHGHDHVAAANALDVPERVLALRLECLTREERRAVELRVARLETGST